MGAYRIKLNEGFGGDHAQAMYLKGQGDLVNWFRTGLAGVSMWLLGVINILTTSP